MPTYGYRCASCGHELEAFQRMSDEPLKTCPDCGGELKKKVYAAGVIFKGSGYYTTDYKSQKGSDGESSNGSGSGSGKAPASSDAKPAAESKGDAKGESKVESKSETKPESKPSKSDSTE